METIEFRYDTQLLLDKYVEAGEDPDEIGRASCRERV